ncbi:hypothetical protein LJK88_07435 [Paenibacillus sp. P26]|nr:hypothetical protein LJK88_07435 [Paenibacillus sp. P26]
MMKMDFWLAAALTIGFSWIASKKLAGDRPVPVFAVSAGISALLFAAGFIVCGYFFDLSYDGQAYHQEAIIHLSNGWNPVYDPEISRRPDRASGSTIMPRRRRLLRRVSIRQRG